METKTLATVRELAKILNVAPGWVYDQTRKGQIPCHRFGKHIRFDVPKVLQSYKVEKSEKAVTNERFDSLEMYDVPDFIL